MNSFGPVLSATPPRIRHDFPRGSPAFFPPRVRFSLDTLSPNTMRKSSSIGLIVGFVLILGAILVGNGWSKFLDPASLLVVMGGTGAALTVGHSFSELRTAFEQIRGIFVFTEPSLQHHVDQLKNFGRIARREGVLALDRRLDAVDSDLLRFGLEMTVDGMEEEEIREMVNQRIVERRRERRLAPKLLTTAGTYSPAFGMVGTLIGLIQMLQNLDDPSQIGAGMATALVTTFYGALLANLVFLPLGNRAKAQNKHREKVELIMREGTLAIARGENPRMIEQRLNHLVNEDAPAPKDAEEAQTTTTQEASDPQPATAAA